MRLVARAAALARQAGRLPARFRESFRLPIRRRARLGIGIRLSRRLTELVVGLAIIPVGGAVTLAATTAPAASSPGSGLASSLLRYRAIWPEQPGSDPPHQLVAAPAAPGAPALVTLPAAPLVTVLTPPPAPTAPPASYPPGSIQAIITAAAEADGVDPNWMLRTAECESGLRPDAYNPAGPYYGIFQFLMSTFKAHGGTNIWDPTQQATIAASMFASGDSVAWPVCSHA
ncbi:MAG TPA: transglycosylase family protein [Candidatus Binatia bacterium]|nr:transglycosylase family protein [Candidatus Binatia bacterium]